MGSLSFLFTFLVGPIVLPSAATLVGGSTFTISATPSASVICYDVKSVSVCVCTFAFVCAREWIGKLTHRIQSLLCFLWPSLELERILSCFAVCFLNFRVTVRPHLHPLRNVLLRPHAQRPPFHTPCRSGLLNCFLLIIVFYCIFAFGWVNLWTPSMLDVCWLAGLKIYCLIWLPLLRGIVLIFGLVLI